MASTNALTPPIAAAWIYMSDDQNYNKVPDFWSEIDFSKVDALFVAPVGLQADGTFGLYDSQKTGPLANRFKWVVDTARSKNPKIKILVSQFWGSAPHIWGYDLTELVKKAPGAIEKYAESVTEFLIKWKVDGYDIDWEYPNVVKEGPEILAKIRSKLDKDYYVTISPATTDYVKDSVKSLSFVNMQTYAGGYGLTPKDFLDLGLSSKQLLYGICPETNQRTRSVKEVEEEYKKNNLAGVHLWRLNSGNYKEENEQQKELFEYLHSESS